MLCCRFLYCLCSRITIAVSTVDLSYIWTYYPLFFISGNIEPNEAESMIQHVEKVFFEGSPSISRALFPSQHLTNRVIKLETGINYSYSAEGLNPKDENSSLIHYIQVRIHRVGKERYR